MRKLSAA